MKGHKDSSGQFHPHSHNTSVVSASDVNQEILKTKPKTKRALELDRFFGGRNRKKFMEDLVKHKLKKDKFGNDVLFMDNARLDFKGEFIYKGVTQSGNVRLGQIVIDSPDGRKTRDIIAKPALGSDGNRRELYTLGWSFIEDL